MSGQAMAGVEVKVKFFASGRELAGTDGLVLQLPQSDSNTETVTRMVKELCPDITEEWLQSVVLAVNEEYVEPGEKVDLKAGDEVAFIPPISGG